MKDLHNSKMQTFRLILFNIVECLLEQEDIIPIKLFSSVRGRNKLVNSSST